MLRFIFTFILSVHGLIHLMGFVNAFGLARVEGLSGQTTISLSNDLIKLLGFLWLVTAVLFIISAISYVGKKEWWWMVAVSAALLSQLLIVLHWPDAKFGTIANILILAGSILVYASWNFQTMVKQELGIFLLDNQKETKIVSTTMLNGLPPVVQKWLIRSKVVGKEMTYQVYLKQKGQMRTKPNGAWMAVSAEEYFTVAKPGFFWVADVEVAPYVHLHARDKYENGRGHMLIKLLSLVPVADSKGKEIDQGTLLRYLGEIVWFPSAALSSYISWQPLENNQAKASMTYGGISASGIFTFTSEGDVMGFEAKRYFDRKEGATLEKWVVTIEENSYKEFEGIRIPTTSSVTWKLKEGDFKWFTVEITALEFNPVRKTQELLVTH